MVSRLRDPNCFRSSALRAAQVDFDRWLVDRPV
jgi:hypothetical protein